VVSAGKVRYVAASNYAPARLAEALDISARHGWASYVALQVHYNLVERDFENELQELCAERGLASLPYFALARGFLTGKYRSASKAGDSRREDAGTEYLDERGPAVLEALDEISAAHGSTLAAVALAWLAAQETVAVPIASARTVEQLADILAVAALELTAEDLERLDSVTDGLARSSANSAWFPRN
jgi:aryl-alcohol dehydrogenase-like predicted oxidoreductase